MTRMKIAVGAAKGLAFLHDADPPVIYRDFKASNILLDSVSKLPVPLRDSRVQFKQIVSLSTCVRQALSVPALGTRTPGTRSSEMQAHLQTVTTNKRGYVDTRHSGDRETTCSAQQRGK